MLVGFGICHAHAATTRHFIIIQANL